MFNNKKRNYSRKVKVIHTNEYHEKTVEYATAADVLMFISLSNESVIQSNDMRIQQCSHIGLTANSLNVGDLIDDKYEVQFINNAGREKIIYMKEIENDGSFN